MNPQPAEDSGELKEKAIGNRRGFVRHRQMDLSQPKLFCPLPSPCQRADPGARCPCHWKAPGGGFPSFLGPLGDSVLSGNVAANDRNPGGFGLGADVGAAAAKGAGCLGPYRLPRRDGGELLDVGAPVRPWQHAWGCSHPRPVRHGTWVPLVTGKYWAVEGEAWGKGSFLETNVSQGRGDAHQ